MNVLVADAEKSCLLTCFDVHCRFCTHLRVPQTGFWFLAPLVSTLPKNEKVSCPAFTPKALHIKAQG